MSLIYLSCAWVAGIFLGSTKFDLPWALIFSGLLPLPLLFFARRRVKPVILTSLCLIAVFGGAFYFPSSPPAFDENHLQFYNNQGVVEIRGMVDRDPEIGDKSTQLQLSTQKIYLDGGWHKVSGAALLFVPRYPAYHYGDVLLVKGKLETPPRLGEFDYQAYLAHRGIYATMLYPEIEVQPGWEGSKALARIYSLRDRLSQTLAEVLPEPQASLAQGIILGIRGNIPSELNDSFVHSGTAHVLAISGLNLSIVAGILLSLGIWLFGRRGYAYIWLALGAIWLYALLTGMDPPVFRAVIMVSLFIVAELLGRQRSAMTALAFAAAIMVAVNPQVLWDAAFQLSFMAMAGLIFIFPRLQFLGRKAVKAGLGEGGVAVPAANFIVDSFSVSLGAIIAVWPLIAHYFGIISWVAPLATFFALLALPGAIVAGTLAGGLGVFVLPVAQAVGWLAWLFLSYMLLVVNGLAALPVSFIEVGPVDARLIWVYYALLTLVIWVTGSWRRLAGLMPKAGSFVAGLPRKWVVPPLAVVAVLVWVTAATLPDDNLHVSFLDVGQGDAVLIQRGSQQVLVDGGPSPQALTLALGKEMPFWDRTIELVVLTHPHADHLTGLVEVFSRYRVLRVLYSDLEYDTPLYNEWLSLIREKNIETVSVRAGQQISLGEVVMEVLNPGEPPLTRTGSDADNNAVVLRLEDGQVSFLLTSDIQREAEFELITRRTGLTSTVLKVAHHGSSTSTTDGFLAVVNPRLAVISVGKDNTYGHPSRQVMVRLEQRLGAGNIYRTDERGTIEFTTDGERLWLRLGK